MSLVQCASSEETKLDGSLAFDRVFYWREEKGSGFHFCNVQSKVN